MKSLFTDYKVSQQTSERKNLKFRFGDYFCSFEERFFQKVFLGADLKISARNCHNYYENSRTPIEHEEN